MDENNFEKDDGNFELDGRKIKNSYKIFGETWNVTLGSKPKDTNMIEYKFVVPTTDAGANDKIQLFRTGAAANLLELGYDAADLDEIIAAATAFNTELIATENLRLEYRNQVAVKDATKQSSLDVIRLWAQRVKTNPLATPEMLATFGIEPSTPVAGPVTPPSELTGTPSANGSCALRWNPNGNVSGTTYLLEASVNGGPWVFTGTTTKSKFVDENATPGVPRTYRVRAQRAGTTSLPGSETSIYSGEEGESITLAA